METDKKIRVEICCGTACYLLGAARLIDLEGNLPEDLRGHVSVTPTSCLGKCARDQISLAPYVRFNGSEWMGNATPSRVIARIRALLERGLRPAEVLDEPENPPPVASPVGIDRLLEQEVEL